MSVPHSEWNNENDGERFRRLKHQLERNPYVSAVELKPGGALDAARVELAQYIGTVPESVVHEVYEQGLAVRSVGGYKSVTVSPPEFRGGDLPPEREQEIAGRGGDGE